MPQTVNPFAAALILAFVAVIVLARFVRRKPPAGASAPTDPSVVWMHSDAGRRPNTPPDQPAWEAMQSSDADKDDPGMPDNEAASRSDTVSGDPGGGGGKDSGGGSD
jgi:hypothetical protein